MREPEPLRFIVEVSIGEQRGTIGTIRVPLTAMLGLGAEADNTSFRFKRAASAGPGVCAASISN
jgi:hypothetical protein